MGIKKSKQHFNSFDEFYAGLHGSQKKRDEKHRLRMKKDFEDYRSNYAGKEDDPEANKNYLFYSNEIPFEPGGVKIEEIHQSWWGDYKRLETNHCYIQWLFPCRSDMGNNYMAQALQLHEAERIQNDPLLNERVLQSYRMMLDFWGMILVDKISGKVERAENWRERFSHLESKYTFHNFLRISRMLKSLGELGLEHLKVPWITFLMHEILEEKKFPHALGSLYNYWIETVKDDEAREELQRNFLSALHTETSNSDRSSIS